MTEREEFLIKTIRALLILARNEETKHYLKRAKQELWRLRLEQRAEKKAA